MKTLSQIANKLKYLPLIVPVYADQITLMPNNSQWNSIAGLTPRGIISGAISLLLLIVALVFFFMLVMGGLRWVLSEGEQKAVESARNQITNALIGLAIVFAAWAILRLINIIFGIDIFNLTIPSLTG